MSNSSTSYTVAPPNTVFANANQRVSYPNDSQYGCL